MGDSVGRCGIGPLPVGSGWQFGVVGGVALAHNVCLWWCGCVGCGLYGIGVDRVWEGPVEGIGLLQ